MKTLNTSTKLIALVNTMKRFSKPLPMALGLMAISLIIVGWKPVKAALADLVNADVFSLPGDAATGQAKAPFQRVAELNVVSGNVAQFAFLDFPDAAEVRIETVTVEARLDVGQSPLFSLQTTVNGVEVIHHLAAQSQGTHVFNGVKHQFCGTHYVRLLADQSGVGPATMKVGLIRRGPATGNVSGSVTISGYTTPLPR